jgi:hypothetical protein
MITKDSISADASDPDFVNVNYVQMDDGIDMGGQLRFELKSLPAVIEMLYACLNTYAFCGIERECGHDSFRVYESGSDQQPMTNILNRRPDGAAHGGVTGLMMTRSAAEDLLKQLLALPAETSIQLTNRLNQQLREAAAGGYSDAVGSALRQGANVNARGQFGDSALNMAAEKGQVDAVEVLLKAGADIENPDVADKTPLMNAAFAGKIKAVELLLRCGARINRDLLNTLQLKVSILEENSEAGMVLPAEAEAWRRFLDFMVERWREQNAQDLSSS